MPERSVEPLSVFISSTFKDLGEYRDAVRAAILGLRNHARDMVYWAADERNPLSLSLDELKGADLMILLLAHRYGAVPDGESRSITEMEFDAARSLGVPVIAFFVDNDHDWPGSSFEWRNYDRLLAFKDKVAQQCTPRFFTTTDSLAALVSQAVANFDKRHRRDTEPQREWTPPLVVGSVTRLEEVADTVVEIGPAEDGLPMLLQVSRSDNLNRPLSEIARVLGQLEESGVQTSLDAFLRALLKNAEGAWRKRGVCDVLVSPSKSARCYVTSRTVAELLSTSLLGSLLPPPRLGDFAYHSPIRKEPATHLLPTAALDVRIQSLGGRNRFLAIPLVGEQRLVVGKDPAQDLPVHAWHEFIYESLAGFEGCEYYVGKGDEALSQGPFEGYARSIDRIFREWMNDDGKAELDASFSISRAALAGAVVQLLTSLQEDYHKSGSVHGDVKPQNSLVTQKGAILIDGLELKAGDVAPAISPVWAAPEQVSMGEVSAPTDIYPVGLIVVSLLGCQLVGEIVRHQIPSEDAGAMTVSFVKNPAIYLPYDTPVVPPSRRSAWSAFVSKCLRFEPEERFSCAGTCADELRTLIEDSPPSGRVTLPLHRGELRLVRLSDGQDRVSRLICDQGYGSETVGGTGPYSPPPPPTAPNVW